MSVFYVFCCVGPAVVLNSKSTSGVTHFLVGEGRFRSATNLAGLEMPEISVLFPKSYHI